jgi:hypothetical protein
MIVGVGVGDTMLDAVGGTTFAVVEVGGGGPRSPRDGAAGSSAVGATGLPPAAVAIRVGPSPLEGAAGESAVVPVARPVAAVEDAAGGVGTRTTRGVGVAPAVAFGRNTVAVASDPAGGRSDVVGEATAAASDAAGRAVPEGCGDSGALGFASERMTHVTPPTMATTTGVTEIAMSSGRLGAKGMLRPSPGSRAVRFPIGPGADRGVEFVPSSPGRAVMVPLVSRRRVPVERVGRRSRFRFHHHDVSLTADSRESQPGV